MLAELHEKGTKLTFDGNGHNEKQSKMPWEGGDAGARALSEVHNAFNRGTATFEMLLVAAGQRDFKDVPRDGTCKFIAIALG